MKTYKCGCFGEAIQFCKIHAAAPELLEAAKSVLEAASLLHGSTDEIYRRMDNLRKTVTKAEGKTQ